MIKLDYNKLNNNIYLLSFFSLIIIIAITYVAFSSIKDNIFLQSKSDGEKIGTIFKQNLSQIEQNFAYFETIDFKQNDENIITDFQTIAQIVFKQTNIINSIGIAKQFPTKDQEIFIKEIHNFNPEFTIKHVAHFTKDKNTSKQTSHAVVLDIFPKTPSIKNVVGLDLRSEYFRNEALNFMEQYNFALSHPLKAFNALKNDFSLSSIIFFGINKPYDQNYYKWLIPASITFENFIKNFIETNDLFKHYKFEYIDATSEESKKIVLFNNTDENFKTLFHQELIEFGGRIYELNIYGTTPYTITNFWQPILGFLSGLFALILVAYYIAFKHKKETELTTARNQLLKAEHIGKMGHFSLNASSLYIKCSYEIVIMMQLPSSNIPFEYLGKIIHQDDYEYMQNLLHKLQTEHATYTEGEFYFKIELDHKTKFIKVIYNANYEEHVLKEVFGIAQDITLQKELENEINDQKEYFQKLATTDYLTKIYNRVYISDLLHHLLNQYKRYHHTFSVVLFDIDHFKRVNDTYGHLEGDRVLVAIATQVSHIIRETDMFARWGGEEFLLILNNTDLENALWVSENLRRQIENLQIIENESITCSFGVTTVKDGDTKDSLLQRADSNLYIAKELGRNRVIQG